MWQETIRIESPYNFDRVLERHALNPLNTLNREKRFIKVPVWLKQVPYVVEVTGLGTVEAPVFFLSGENEKEALIQRAAEIFQWNVSLKKIHEHFQDTALNQLFAEHFGTPLVLDFDPFESLIKSIIHQQLNLKFAYTLTERFVKTFGFEKNGVWFYPSPDTVAGLTVEQLRKLQFSQRKAEYVIGIGEAAAKGDLDFDSLKLESDEEIFKKLIQYRGIGNWTVQNFLLFALGRPNLFPAADIGIQNALKKLLKLEQKPSIEEMKQLTEGWAPYLSYASLYLWRSIENVE